MRIVREVKTDADLSNRHSFSRRIGATAMPLELLFSAWSALHYPGLFTEALTNKLNPDTHTALRKLSREEFYQAYHDAYEAGVLPPEWR